MTYFPGKSLSINCRISLQCVMSKKESEEFFRKLHQSCIIALFSNSTDHTESYLSYASATCLLPSFDSITQLNVCSHDDKLLLNELYDYINSTSYKNLTDELCAFSFWNFYKCIGSNFNEQISFPKLVASVTSFYDELIDKITELFFRLNNIPSLKEYSKFIFCNL